MKECWPINQILIRIIRNSCISLQINGRSHTLVWFEIQVKRTISASNTEAQVVNSFK